MIVAEGQKENENKREKTAVDVTRGGEIINDVPRLVSNDTHQITKQGSVVSATKSNLSTNESQHKVFYALAVAPKIRHKHWINLRIPSATGTMKRNQTKN